MQDTIRDDLERDFGVAIFESLISQPLRKKGQKVRLFDQTRNSAESYYPSDRKGKPTIYNHQTDEYWYPITAYAKANDIDSTTALADLCRQYYGIDLNKKRSKKAILHTNVYRGRDRPTPVLLQEICHLPIDLYHRCQTLFERNGLYEYLRYTFSSSKADEVFALYHLGTSKHWRHLGYLSTCLPQFDIDRNLRQVKIMPFDAMNGRRIKTKQEAEYWERTERRFKSTQAGKDKIFFAGKEIAKQAGMTDVCLKQCLFGEHLLKEYPGKKVALVEGESTAIVCSIVLPDYLWLATGGSSGAGWTKPEIFGVLQGRDVTLWPDSGKYAEWREKAEPLQPLVEVLRVASYVEQIAYGKSNFDIRDVLMRPCYRPADGSGIILGEVL